MNEPVELTWLGHSCFRMEYRGWSLITDPYRDGSVPGLPPLRLGADAVYCSHGHGDHGFADAVTLSGRPAPEDFAVEEALCPHDDRGGALRGMNTVRRFHFGALTVAHAGDLGCPPEGAAAALLRNVSLLLVPVGGYYTIDAAQAADVVRRSGCRCAVPMHYRDGARGFDVLGTADAFTACFSAVQRGGATLRLTEDGPVGVVLLEPASAMTP